jgi:hypothetical protein
VQELDRGRFACLPNNRHGEDRYVFHRCYRNPGPLGRDRAACVWWSGATPPQDELWRARAASRVLIRG